MSIDTTYYVPGHDWLIIIQVRFYVREYFPAYLEFSWERKRLHRMKIVERVTEINVPCDGTCNSPFHKMVNFYHSQLKNREEYIFGECIGQMAAKMTTSWHAVRSFFR